MCLNLVADKSNTGTQIQCAAQNVTRAAFFLVSFIAINQF